MDRIIADLKSALASAKTEVEGGDEYKYARAYGMLTMAIELAVDGLERRAA